MRIPFKVIGLPVLSLSLLVSGCGEGAKSSFNPLVTKDAKLVVALNLDKDQAFKMVDSYLKMVADMHVLDEDALKEAKEKVETCKKDIFACCDDCDPKVREFVEKSGLRDAKLKWAVASMEDFKVVDGEPRPEGFCVAIGGKLDLEKAIAACEGEKDCDVSFEKTELEGETAWRIVPHRASQAREMKKAGIDPCVASLGGRLSLLAMSRDTLAKQIRLYKKGEGKGDALAGFSAAEGELMRLQLSGIGDMVKQNVPRSDLRQIGNAVPDGDKLVGRLQDLTIDMKVEPDGMPSGTIRLKAASEEDADTLRTLAKTGLMVATAQLSNAHETPEEMVKVIKDIKIGGNDGVVEVQSGASIGALLAKVASDNVTGHIAKTRITAAEAGVRALQEACTTYYIEHKKLPSSLDQLIDGDDPIIEGGECVLYDPWGNKYELEVRGKRIIIKSAGEDGQMDTEDDIRSDVKK